MLLMESSAVRARELRRLDLLDDAARERTTASAVVPRATHPASPAWPAWISRVYGAVANLITRPHVTQAERSAHGAS
jgi:hypothetical protein